MTFNRKFVIFVLDNRINMGYKKKSRVSTLFTLKGLSKKSDSPFCYCLFR